MTQTTDEVEFQCGWTTKGYDACTVDKRVQGWGAHVHNCKKIPKYYLREKFFVQVSRAFGAPSVRFGDFAKIEDAEKFIDDHLPHGGGIYKMFAPEQFPTGELPNEVWQ